MFWWKKQPFGKNTKESTVIVITKKCWENQKMIFCTDDGMHCFLHWLSNSNANENIEELTESGFVRNMKECMNSIKYIHENCNYIVFLTARVFSLIKKLIPYKLFCLENIDIKLVFTLFKFKNCFSYKDLIFDDLESFLVYKFICAICSRSIPKWVTNLIFFKYSHPNIACFGSHKIFFPLK